jgi:hypothetical protein
MSYGGAVRGRAVGWRRVLEPCGWRCCVLADLRAAWVGQRVWRVGRHGVGDKKIMFLTKKKARQIAISMVVPPSCHRATWRVGPAWGVRRARIGWEKFSIVFAPYSIDYLLLLSAQLFAITYTYTYTYTYTKRGRLARHTYIMRVVLA